MSRREQELLDVIVNIKSNIFFQIKRIADKDLRHSLKVNKKYKNIHQGKRCFILGNGPSLREEDLSMLKDEIVFTVNNMVQSPIFNDVQSNYHVLADPDYFNLDRNLPEDRAILELYDKLKLVKKPVCIFVYSGAGFVKKEGLDAFLEVAYTYTGLRMTENFRKEINMTKNMPSAQTVVQLAIYAAIYMGLKEIYLLGCDMTGLLQNYEKRDDIFDNERYNHAYEYSEMAKKFICKQAARESNEFMLEGYTKMFSIYRKLKVYCDKRDICITNLTQGGALDVFPRKMLKDIKNID